MKNYLIFLFCILQGCNSAAQNDSLCDKYKLAVSEFELEYKLYGDTAKLDSALYYMELVIIHCPHDSIGQLTWYKLGLLSLKHNYDAGIELIPTLKNPFFYEIPYYNSVLLKRFKAMKSLYEGDTATYKQYVYSILEEIAPFIAEHQATLDTLCKNNLSTIFKNSTYPFTQIQYYYYKSLIESDEILETELDVLKQKGYDLEYIEYIKLGFTDDFLIYEMY